MDDDLIARIERAREALRDAGGDDARGDDARGDVPGLLRELAGAHLTRAFAADHWQTALAQGCYAADVLEVAASIARPEGTGTELFLDDHYETSVLPRALGPGARATVVTWLDALHAAMWVNRLENYEALAGDLPLVAQTPSDLAAYAQLALAFVRGESIVERAASIPLDRVEPSEWAGWMGAAIHTWRSIQGGDRDEIRFGLARMLEREPPGGALVEGVSLGASAMLAYATQLGVGVEPFDPRLRLPPTGP